MTRIRVAVGEVQSAMLRDILAQITDQQPDMELVGQVRQPNFKDANFKDANFKDANFKDASFKDASFKDASFKDAVADQRPDVLICDVRPEELPEVCRELFSDPDPPVVVGLAREGREAAVCIANAGAAQLMSVIRTAILDATKESKVVELVRPADAERGAAATNPYTSNADCLDDQLRCLDLALLAEVDALSTIWDDSAQRLQGLAISPDEVRALLQGSRPAASQRQSGDLRRRRLRLQEWTAKRMAATLGRPDAPPLVRLIERFNLGPFEQFCIAATLALEIDRNKYGKAYALLQDDVTRKQPSLELFLRLFEDLGEAERWGAARVFDTSRPLRRWNLLRFGPRDAGEPATPFGRRIELDDRISRFLLGLDDLGSQLEEFAVIGPWEPEALRVPPASRTVDRLVQLVAEVQRRAPGAPPRLVLHVHGRHGTGRRSLVAAICQRRGLRLLRVDAGRLATLPAAAFEESCLCLPVNPRCSRRPCASKTSIRYWRMTRPRRMDCGRSYRCCGCSCR